MAKKVNIIEGARIIYRQHSDLPGLPTSGLPRPDTAYQTVYKDGETGAAIDQCRQAADQLNSATDLGFPGITDSLEPKVVDVSSLWDGAVFGRAEWGRKDLLTGGGRGRPIPMEWSDPFKVRVRRYLTKSGALVDLETSAGQTGDNVAAKGDGGYLYIEIEVDAAKLYLREITYNKPIDLGSGVGSFTNPQESFTNLTAGNSVRREFPDVKRYTNGSSSLYHIIHVYEWRDTYYFYGGLRINGWVDQRILPNGTVVSLAPANHPTDKDEI